MRDEEKANGEYEGNPGGEEEGSRRGYADVARQGDEATRGDKRRGYALSHTVFSTGDKPELRVGGKDEELRRRDKIVDSGVDTTMYKGLYLLQKRWSIKHDESIMVTYGITMACYPVHGPRRMEWGIWSICGATWEEVDTWLMLQLVYQYCKNVLQGSILFYNVR